MNVLSGLSVVAVLVILGLVIGVGALFWVKARYRTVPSNEALVVTGPKLGDEKKEKNIYRDDEGRYMKIIRGGGHRLRMFQTATTVSLKSFQLEMRTPKVYTKHGVGITASAVATVKVSGTLDGIVKYAEQFLGKDQDEVESEINAVLNSNLRAILSELTVEEINGDKQSFNERVREVAQAQLKRMGFDITALNLSDLSDDEGYLENLGRPQSAKVKEEADKAESESRRATEMKVAEDNEAIERENYKRQMAISNDKREKDLLDADNLTKTNKAKASAEAAGELEREERRLEITRQRLEIKEQEKENELKLVKQERENELTIERKKRENDVAIEEQQVKIRRQQVDADTYAKRESAKAEADEVREKSQAEVETIRLRGDAEAENIKKMGEAEAEAIRLKAEAMRENGEIILQELMIRTLPEFARASTEYMSNIESLRVWDNGGSNDGGSLKSLLNNPVSTMANLQEQAQQMTGTQLGGLFGKLLGSGEVIKDYESEDNKDGKEYNSNSEDYNSEDSNEGVENTETEDDSFGKEVKEGIDKFID